MTQYPSFYSPRGSTDSTDSTQSATFSPQGHQEQSGPQLLSSANTLRPGQCVLCRGPLTRPQQEEDDHGSCPMAGRQEVICAVCAVPPLCEQCMNTHKDIGGSTYGACCSCSKELCRTTSAACKHCGLEGLCRSCLRNHQCKHGCDHETPRQQRRGDDSGRPRGPHRRPAPIETPTPNASAEAPADQSREGG